MMRRKSRVIIAVGRTSRQVLMVLSKRKKGRIIVLTISPVTAQRRLLIRTTRVCIGRKMIMS